MKFGISTISEDSIYCAYAIIGLRNGLEYEIPTLLDFNITCEWGETKYNINIDIEPSDISYIDIAWKKTTDESYYKKKVTNLSKKMCDLSEKFQQNLIIKVGLTPYGVIALWIEDFLGQRELLSVDDVTNGRLHHTNESYKIVLKRMAQYSYRFLVYDSLNSSESVTHIKILRFDGSKHYYYESTTYSKFEMHGIPSKLLVKIAKERCIVQSFIWFDFSVISGIFDRFYGTHPETKSDLIIKIDVEKQKYELALYRQGLKEPVVIPESAYQLIVFKNKFEDYRSENYNQPRGAWIW